MAIATEWTRLKPMKDGFFWVIYSNNTYGIVYNDVSNNHIESLVPQANGLIALWKGPMQLPSLQRAIERGLIGQDKPVCIMGA